MVFAVHKVVDFSCPIDLVKCIKTKFPQMIKKKDLSDRNPFARALCSPHGASKELIQFFLQDSINALTRNEYGRIPFHLEILNRMQ
jgi:hypothetical protein